MHRNTRRLAAACIGLLVGIGLAAPAPAAHAAERVRVIFDTDIEFDVDDAGAVAVLHALADNGEAEILAMMVNSDTQWGAPALDALNTWYGRPDIPIGTLKPTDEYTGSDYNREVAEEFPRDLASGFDAPDATTLYRQVLAAQPDDSVVIASVGFLTNLAELLASPPDDISPLSGVELVRDKVRLLSAMAGWFPSGKEFNITQEKAAGAAALNAWPGRAVFSGYEIGDSVYTGAALAGLPQDNPVRRAYEAYYADDDVEDWDRASWDQTAVYYAVRGGGGLFGLAGDTGSISVDPADGSNTWDTAVDKDQNYLTTVVPDSEIETAIEALMTQPRRTGGPAVDSLRVNLNGPSVTVDGRVWRAESEAAGLSVGPVNRATNTVTPVPAPPAGVRTMLATELWRTGDIALSAPVADGEYDVHLWVMEDYRDGYRRFDVRLESALATTVTTGAVGSWQRYGPLPVTVSDGRIDVDLVRVYGDTLIQGLSVVPRGQPA